MRRAADASQDLGQVNGLRKLVGSSNRPHRANWDAVSMGGRGMGEAAGVESLVILLELLFAVV